MYDEEEEEDESRSMRPISIEEALYLLYFDAKHPAYCADRFVEGLEVAQACYFLSISYMLSEYIKYYDSDDCLLYFTNYINNISDDMKLAIKKYTDKNAKKKRYKLPEAKKKQKKHDE